MELLAQFADIVLHLDRHLTVLIASYGVWVYVILFAIIYCETGLVVTPFLPGDSLLFVAGALAATGALYAPGLYVLLVLAACGGDNTNYWIGRLLGPRVFRRERSKLFNPAHLERTHAFFEKYGTKAVIFARFMPILRTFTPFVAGIGRMPYPRYLGYSFLGALCWIGFFIYGGYFFGNVPWVKENLTLAISIIIVLSFMPGVVEYIRHRQPTHK